MAETYQQENKKCQSKYTLRNILFRRVLAWTFTLFLIIASGTVIVGLGIFLNSNVSVTRLSEAQTNWFERNILQIVTTCISLGVPEVMLLIPRFEAYQSGKTVLIVNLSRIFCLRIINIIAFVLGLIARSSNIVVCYGSDIGREIYKLIITDTLFGGIGKFVRYYAISSFLGRKKEFDIPNTILLLIHRQTIIWLGTIVCPVMPLVGTLSFTIVFFLNYWTIKVSCQPPVKRWNQGRDTFHFMVFLVLSLFIILVPVGIVLSGTFINLGNTGDEDGAYEGPFPKGEPPTRVYEIFVDSISNTALRNILQVIASGVIILPGVMIMIAVIHYLNVRLTAELQRVDMLKKELEDALSENKNLLKEKLAFKRIRHGMEGASIKSKTPSHYRDSRILEMPTQTSVPQINETIPEDANSTSSSEGETISDSMDSTLPPSIHMSQINAEERK